jgi:N-acetylglucosaminyldiphosphoundecaprenol N-acetyl-beta-D-mannosaminyltransferase
LKRYLASSTLGHRTYWLAGLPFDCVSIADACELVHDAARSRCRLVFATPNLNFVTLARRDPDFRQLILDTDLSLVDGMPLVWLGRRVGIPFSERVAGSSLIDALRASARRPALRVFFLGGLPGIAERASRALSDEDGGLVGVGGACPGFGSVEEMSSAALLAQINESNADLLVVAMGAKKGHQWIARNADLLSVPLISHLGAVVNFVSGALRRAPKPVQDVGAEWLWRIMQEPGLITRYWHDGLSFLQMLRAGTPRSLTSGSSCDPTIVSTTHGELAHTVHVRGPLTGDGIELVDSELKRSVVVGRQVVLDLTAITGIDSRGVGWVYAVRYRRTVGSVEVISPASTEVRAHLTATFALDVFRQGTSR